MSIEVHPGWATRIWTAASGAVGTVSGVAPHVLHHVGPLAGAAVLSGASGSVLFGALGLALMTPMLLRLRRRFGTWLAPGFALVVFSAMFALSTFVIGPAVRDALGASTAPGVTPTADPHGH